MTSLEDYHKSRRNAKTEALFAILYLQVTINPECTNIILNFTFKLLQSLTVPLQGFLNAIVYAWTREDFLQKMGIQSGINDDITIDYDDAVSNQDDMERSIDSSYNSSRSRALEDSATMSVRSIPVDCPSVYDRRESITADCHRENLPYLSDHGCYNTF